MTKSGRSPEADRALDGVLAALCERGFVPPDVDPAKNRDALASALVDAAIEAFLRVRIVDARRQL